MSEKMRESFELWWRSLGHQGFRKKPDGRYGFGHTETAWQAWQASRAALVVELPPEREERFIDSYQEGWNDAIDSCRVLVESVGVTCK